MPGDFRLLLCDSDAVFVTYVFLKTVQSTGQKESKKAKGIQFPKKSKR